jgi:hypothetical protein
VIFKPELAERILRGEKTQTRRIPSDNPRSPWFDAGRSFTPGRTYAIQPGRSKPSVGRVEILAVSREVLGSIVPGDAEAEGFSNREEFFDYWRRLHGDIDLDAEVWALRFRLETA